MKWGVHVRVCVCQGACVCSCVWIFAHTQADVHKYVECSWFTRSNRCFCRCERLVGTHEQMARSQMKLWDWLDEILWFYLTPRVCLCCKGKLRLCLPRPSGSALQRPAWGWAAVRGSRGCEQQQKGLGLESRLWVTGGTPPSLSLSLLSSRTALILTLVTIILYNTIVPTTIIHWDYS